MYNPGVKKQIKNKKGNLKIPRTKKYQNIISDNIKANIRVLVRLKCYHIYCM